MYKGKGKVTKNFKDSHQYMFFQIVQMFEEAAIRYKGSVQLAVIDHISSSSATLLPIKKIANKLRPLGVLVLVDGAHAPGQGI